jgi:hypothetical protein
VPIDHFPKSVSNKMFVRSYFPVSLIHLKSQLQCFLNFFYQQFIRSSKTIPRWILYGYTLTALQLSWGLELYYSRTLECSDTAIIIFTRIAVHIIVKMLNTHDEFGTYKIYSTATPANEAMKATVDMNNPNRPLKSTQKVTCVNALQILTLLWSNWDTTISAN